MSWSIYSTLEYREEVRDRRLIQLVTERLLLLQDYSLWPFVSFYILRVIVTLNYKIHLPRVSPGVPWLLK